MRALATGPPGHFPPETDMARKPVYKVIFHNQGKLYEIYARSVAQGDLYGFVCVEKLVFGERSTLLVDPAEEQIKSEFSGVTRTYIPMHAVVRIDEVQREGAAKMVPGPGGGDNVRPFPVYTQTTDPTKI